MGQYYKIVNVDKRQYLNPHAFGCGLKLMEFSCSQFGPQQALCILLAHSNGRGGGDLHTDNLSEPERALIGSWAGDRIVVAGDYDDNGLFIPPDLHGKEYEEESSRGYVPDHLNPDGKEYAKFTQRFGWRWRKNDADQWENVEEGGTLYACAELFFQDISDDIIKIVAKGDNGHHPWAAIDASDDGWRRVPGWGVLPETDPKKPIAGKRAYNAYKKGAKTQGQDLADDLGWYIRRYHPELRDELIRRVIEVIDKKDD